MTLLGSDLKYLRITSFWCQQVNRCLKLHVAHPEPNLQELQMNISNEENVSSVHPKGCHLDMFNQLDIKVLRTC